MCTPQWPAGSPDSVYPGRDSSDYFGGSGAGAGAGAGAGGGSDRAHSSAGSGSNVSGGGHTVVCDLEASPDARSSNGRGSNGSGYGLVGASDVEASHEDSYGPPSPAPSSTHNATTLMGSPEPCSPAASCQGAC